MTIAIVFTWCLRGWWEGRKADRNNPASDYQQSVATKNNGREGRQAQGVRRRNGFGWALWQLRHGWAPMAQDVRDGWNQAQQARGAGTFDGMTIREAAKAAWDAAKPKAKTVAPPPDHAETVPDPTAPAVPDSTPPVDPQGDAGSPDPTPPSTPAPTGVPTVTEIQASEVNNLDALRQYLILERDRATTRLERANTAIEGVRRSIANHDAVCAQLAQAGLGPQTTEPLAALMESAQGRLQRNLALAAAAEQDIAVANRALDLLVSQGHQNVQEAVTGASAPVARDTTFYQPV